MNLGRPLDPGAKALLRPIGLWGKGSLWLLALAGVLGPAWLAPTNVTACLWLLLWGAFVFACWVRSVMRRAVAARYRQPPECLRVDDPFRRRTRQMFVVVTLLVVTKAPFFLALVLSGPWLDRYAHHVLYVLPANVDPPQRPGLYGLVLVGRINASATTVTFELVGGGEISYRTTPDGKGLRRTSDTWLDSFRWF